MFFSRQDYSVFFLDANEQFKKKSYPVGPLTPIRATEKSITKFFSDDLKRKRRFLGFLHRGYLGHFFVYNDVWAAYAWLSPSENFDPKHMRSIRPEKAAWIFNCRTAEQFRSRGLYQNSIIILIELLRTKYEKKDVFIDTQSNNSAAINGIVSVGFQPFAIVERLQVRIPGIYTWSRTQLKHKECAKNISPYIKTQNPKGQRD